MSVYKAISAVSLALSKDGIGKDRKNEQQGYKFRGIDDVYNALAPLLSANGLCILPRVLSRECVERESRNGGALFYVTVHVEFDLVSADDGSKHIVAMYGEAMDSGDKATNKAMSAAYKYMAMEVFAIPTEGDNDADAQTHEVVSKGRQPKPATFSEWNKISDAHKKCLLDAREEMTTFVAAEKYAAAASVFDNQKDVTDDEGFVLFEEDAKLALWSCFNSAERSGMKKHSKYLKEQ